MRNRIIGNLLFTVVSIVTICALLNQQAVAKMYGTPQVTAKQDANGRVRYAKTLLSFLNNVDASIPSLSPSQKQWLKKERGEYVKSKNIMRYAETMDTKEYQIETAKDCLTQMVATLGLIIKKPPLKEEMYLWSLVTEHLMFTDFCYSLYELINKYSIVDKKLFYLGSPATVDVNQFYFNNGMIPAWQILRNIIQPYLEKESQ